LTVAHTYRYHRRRRSVGHVWQGRFKSPVIQDNDHLLVVLRYIEGNPLRAGMVSDLSDYPWTRYAAHGLGRPNGLISELPAWSTLAATEAARQKYWRGWVHTPQTEKELAALRRSVTSGRPFGNESWTHGMSERLGLSSESKRRGRPLKSRPAEDKIKQNCSEN